LNRSRMINTVTPLSNFPGEAAAVGRFEVGEDP